MNTLHTRSKLRLPACRVFITSILAAYTAPTFAVDNVTSSGLGTVVGVVAPNPGTNNLVTGAAISKDYAISGGTLRTSNLFHSFGEFSLSPDESATFGPTTASNIIGRVTGGSESIINGQINSASPANLYLINPAGMVFGASASLNVDGVFHATTADYLKMGDDSEFHAAPQAGEVLSSAAPQAFGFLAPSAEIRVEGSRIVGTSANQGIQLAAGNITIENASIELPGGDISLRAMNEAGEIAVIPNPDSDTSPASGTVTITNSTLKGPEAGPPIGRVYLSGDQVNLSGSNILAAADNAASGGNVWVKSNALDLNSSSIFSTTKGSAQGGSIDVDTGQLLLRNGGYLDASTLGSGDAGNISIAADESITLTGSREVGNQRVASSIRSTTGSSGKAGGITLETQSVNITNGGEIIGWTKGSGEGGTVEIFADTLSMDNGSIFVSSYDQGNGGNLWVELEKSLVLTNNSALDANTSGSGLGGSIEIFAGQSILVDHSVIQNMSRSLADSPPATGDAGIMTFSTPNLVLRNGGIINAGTTGFGDGGGITVDADNVVLRSGGVITAGTTGFGNGGIIDVHADTVLVTGSGNAVPSGIIGTTTSSGDAALVSIGAREILIADGGIVSSSTNGTGEAGDVHVSADRLTIDNAVLRNSSNANASGGTGTIHLHVDDLVVRNRGIIASEMLGENPAWTDPANDAGWSGGTVKGVIGNLLLDNGTISTTNKSMTSKGGGEIDLRLGQATLQNGGAILSETWSNALGGDIHLSDMNVESGIAPAASISLSGQSRISASARGNVTGNGGSVTLFANLLTLDDGSGIGATSESASDAGSVTVNGTQWKGEEVNLLGNSRITVASALGNAGDINIYANKWLYMRDSQITTSAAGGQGNGGNILIDPQFVILNNSQIIANAMQGQGGNITIITQFLLQSTNSSISASSQFGLQGTVSIQSAQSNIAGSISVLPGVFMDASGLIQEGCGRSGQSSSTFTSSAMQGVVLSSPDNALDYVPASLEGCSLSL
ncbi:MAG TPA: filamentous hemagglutinin N-terminal domain-containing protein [Methylococcaceae bacterium]|nr:filamentous hemagglutinin N-terminal domain-containing protein [Methylococcaceae bacterium]